jgi:hypothetical protein
MTWDSVNSWFELTRSQAAVGQWTYFVNTTSESTYGISVLQSGGQSIDIIWDRIVVRTTLVDDDRVDVGSSCEIRVTLWLEYDNSLLGAGDAVTLDGSPMMWDSVNSWFEVSRFQASVGQWRYHVNASTETGYGITALELNGSSIDVIWDRIKVVSYETSDSRDNIGSYVWINVTLHYEFDDTPMTDGTVSVNGYAFIHLENGKWQHNRTELAVIERTFDTVVCGGSGHLITVVNQNAQWMSVIWDSLTVSLTIPDHRIDVGENASIYVSAVYDYDGTSYDGVFTLNDTTYVHDTVGQWAFTVIAAAGDTFSITEISTNDVDYVIWDRLRVLSYTVSDSRCDIGTTQSVYVALEYEFDSTIFTGALGTVYLNGSSMTWNQSLLHWYQDTAFMTSGKRQFQVTGVTDNLHGLTVINQQAAPAAIIWDKIEVALNADALVVNWHTQVNFTLTATREYDGSQVQVLIVSVNRNGSLYATGNFSDVWHGPVDAGWLYTVTGARDDQYGLQIYSANSLMVIWTERPVVVIDTAFVSDSDGRTNIGTVVTIFFHCEWSTNGSAVDTGTLFVNMTAYAINSTGWVDFTWSSASVLRLIWSVTGVDANGIIQYDQRVASPAIAWDSLEITISVLDDRIGVDENATILVSGTYESDGVLFDGILLLNSTTFLYSTPSSHAYTVIAAFGDSYGITVIGTNDIAVVIWDRILVTGYTVSDSRCDVGTTQRVSLSAIHEYDGAVLTGARGVVYLNGTPMLWNPLTQVWFLDVDSAIVTRLLFVVSDIEDFVEEIVVFDPGVPLSITWDSIEISIAIGDQRINIGDNASVYVSAHYTFDNSTYDGILLLNDTIFEYSTVGRRGYTVVSAFGDTFEITIINTNDADYIIWDSVTVTIVVEDNRINVGENATIWLSANYTFDSTPYDGNITLNNTVYQYSTVGRRGYKASIASGGTHGVTVIGYSVEEFVIWDSLQVFIVNYYPHLDIGQNATIDVYALYDYDGEQYDGTLILNETVYLLSTVGRKGYICESAFGDTYNITYIRFSERAYVIWDSVTVTISVDESYISVGTVASITVTGTFDYDGSPYTGLLMLNDTNHQYDTVGRRGYMCIFAIPSGHAVSYISYSNAAYIIWDQLEVYWSESERSRVDLNEEVDVMFRVRRGYTGSMFTDSDGIVFINGIEATFQETEGYWYITATSSEVVTQSYSITGHSDLVGGIEAIIGETIFTCTTIWDLIYVSHAGVWGSAPAFDPEIDSPAGRTLQCELGWTVTVYFYLNYMSDDGVLSDPTATVIVNGQNAIFSEERQRWELNVTSQGIGVIQYIIEEILDSYGLKQVDQRGLYPTINWFPVRLAMSIATYGGLGLAGVGVALFIRRTRRRVAVLEEALGPERVMSIEEADLPVKVREEILASLDWLRDLQEQIPSLDTAILLSVKEELGNAHDLYTKAFGDFMNEEYLTDPGLRLKHALITRVDVLIRIVDRELNLRA